MISPIQPLAFFADHNQELENSVMMNASYTPSRATRATFNQMLQHANSLILSKNHIAKRIFFPFAERLATGQSAKALMTMSVFAEFLAGVLQVSPSIVCLLPKQQEQHFA
ncbi:MAG: hypothetical protein WBV94_05480 [Blastocatellia bacterium]